MSDKEEWIDPSEDDDDGEYSSEWAPVVMAAIIAGTILFICLICGETATNIASILWGNK